MSSASPGSPPPPAAGRARLGSVRRALAWRVSAGVVAALAAFAAALHLFVHIPGAQRQGSLNLATAAALVRERMAGLFGQVEGDLSAARSRGEAGGLSLGDLEGFNAWFMPLLSGRSAVSSVLLADEGGREFLLLRLPDGTWMNRVTDPAARPGRMQRIFRDPAGRVVSRESEASDYDARRRPWYQGALAMSAGAAVNWTEPYRFFTTREPGITASTRWRGADGRLRVIAFDVLLRDLATATRTVTVSPGGMAMLLTGDGRVLAPPRHDAVADKDVAWKLLAPAEQLGIPAVTAAVAAVRASRSERVSMLDLDVSGRHWLGRAERYPLSPREALVLTLAPAEDFVPPAGQLAATLVVAGSLVVLVGVLLARRLARRFVAPLEALAERSERIGALDFAQSPRIDTPWREIARLAAAQDRMRELLSRATRDLEDANRHLEARIAERTRALEATNAELASFSYAVSHDLRAPLRAIDGYCAILEQEHGRALDEEARGHLARVREASQHMSALIDSLLLLARMSSHPLVRQPVDLSALARTTLERLGASDPGREVEQRIADGCVAHGDPALLGSVLGNLLGNAWKFTARTPGAMIAFDCAHEDGQTVFRVADNGAGFDRAGTARLFEPFQRAHGAAEFPGTGIGLAIVHRILEQHGGTIRAESEPGRGATFRFTVGGGESTAGPSGVQAASSPASSGDPHETA